MGAEVARQAYGVEVSTGLGEDERAERLEKYIPDLAVLSLQGDASTIVCDWIALSTRSLSPSAGTWWRDFSYDEARDGTRQGWFALSIRSILAAGAESPFNVAQGHARDNPARC